MNRMKVIVAMALMVCGTAGAIWIRQWSTRPWKDAGGKPNVSMLGSEFGSVGQGSVVSFDGVVAEVKPDGFVVIREPSGHPPMLVGAINPASGVPDLKERDAVRVELRWYRVEVGDDYPKRVFIVTKRLEQ